MVILVFKLFGLFCHFVKIKKGWWGMVECAKTKIEE